MINEETFASRLTSLREQKKVSAREMSLDLGQNGSYINQIENRKAFPSMQCFFYICDYLQISPAAFFWWYHQSPTCTGYTYRTAKNSVCRTAWANRPDCPGIFRKIKHPSKKRYWKQNSFLVLSIFFQMSFIYWSFIYWSFLILIYYSNSTITNQFCLEIIHCRVCSSFDYLIYPYYPAYTG